METESSGLWISCAMVAARRPATASFSLASRAARVLRSMGDVAEDHDDAGEFAGLVADGRAAVVDGELGAVFADQDGVVGEADDAVETLDLGDGVFDVLPGGLVDDVEDFLDRTVDGLGLEPAGELLGDDVHHLDVAVGVAGDDSVADGGERGAQVLFGLEELFGAEALQVERLAEGGGDCFEAAAGEEADDEADGDGKEDKDDDHLANLSAPLVDVVLLERFSEALMMYSRWPRIESIADLPVRLRSIVVGLAAGGDDGDQRFGEARTPGIVFRDEVP